jgi:hypothetical protein
MNFRRRQNRGKPDPDKTVGGTLEFIARVNRKMPKVSKLPKMPKVNVFYLFYEIKNSR